MRKFLFSLVLIVLAISLVMFGCAKPTTTPTTTPSTTTPSTAPAKELNVGFAGPLTGPVAGVGIEMKLGFEDAVADRNDQGGVTIAGEKYILNPIIRDTKADPATGKSVAEELVDQHGVTSIMGAFVPDGLGMVPFTEQSKVFLFPLDVSASAPDHPFTFVTGGVPLLMTVIAFSYIPVHYPELKDVVSLIIDAPDLEYWDGSVQVACMRSGLNYLGYEKVPVTTADFSPIIQRVLAKNPDIVDTSNVTAVLATMCPLLVKQLREAGYEGLIISPCGYISGILEQAVPKQDLTMLATDTFDLNNPISPASTKALYERFRSREGRDPSSSYLGQYDVYKAYFDFLDGQDTMDTTAWMAGFEDYRWPSIWGIERYWIGEKIFGISRVVMYRNQVAEYTDGVLGPSWTAPLPYDLFE